ncbi:putative pheophorbide a oxygenase [Helianthus anomalus]
MLWCGGIRTENEWKVFDDRCPHRLAPLSEGRVDQWGRLQLYSFEKACVAVYPSTVQNDIVWFWPNTDSRYKDILTEKKPSYVPELDDPSFSFQIFNRDIPYGCEVLIENLMDPSHVPYAHHGMTRTQQPR